MAENSKLARPYDGDRDRAQVDAEVSRRRAEKPTGPRKTMRDVDRELEADGHTKPGAWRNQPTCKGKTMGELDDEFMLERRQVEQGLRPPPKPMMELLRETQQGRGGAA